MRVGYLTFDFEHDASSFGFTDTVYLAPTATGSVFIPAPTLAPAYGTRVGVVLAQFVQEVNKQFYPLKNEQSVVLHVVGLDAP